MMRCDEAQGAILHEVFEESSEDEDAGPNDDERDAPSSPYDRFLVSEAMGGAPKLKPVPLAEPKRSSRGMRVSLKELEAAPGMYQLPDALGVDEDTTVTVVKSVRTVAAF